MNLIFDLGSVLVEWNPKKMIAEFDISAEQKILITKELFDHADWLALDKGTKTEKAVITAVANRTGMSVQLIGKLLIDTRETHTEIKPTSALLPKLKANGHNLYCLSNMSHETFDYLKSFEFFKYFDDIIISAHIQMIKPDVEIFNYMLKKFDISAQDSIFIDDKLENIQAAQSVGIKGILFDQSDVAYSRVAAFT
ncbi:MAG: HAD family phosphatase [Rhizobiales bacterium]|nr:HAD family phosphatase [Hyphomicrobiales bacterium]NRB14792.1 HAD family phosphatase [Hyphomicrobiales bacterium]